MGVPREPGKEIPVAGLIYNKLAPVEEILDRLVVLLGEVVFRSDEIDFAFTSYYEKEMGTGLKRVWLSFGKPVDPGRLAGIKIASNALESQTALDGRRVVNVDPGILSPGHLILATTKNAFHRIYVGKGIYAETTLLFEKGTYRFLPWTYPDYRTDVCVDFMMSVRKEQALPLVRGGR